MPAVWFEGAPEVSEWGGLKRKGRASVQIVAYRCPSCKLLRFYAP